MADGGAHCKIIHIPDKPPISPHLQPTVKVHAAHIQPKHANTLIRKLNQIAPLENLLHVKRVRKIKSPGGGECQLSVILCVALEDDDQLDTMPKDVMELIDSFHHRFINMLLPQKKSGKYNVNCGQLPIIHLHII